MSTKIYEGLILRKPLEKVYPELVKAFDIIRALALRQMVDRLIRSTIATLDARALGIPLPPLPAESTGEIVSTEKFRERLEREKEDWACCLCIAPDAGDTLLLPFLDSESLAALKTLLPVQDYCYFNNTDRPEDVTDAEWKLRKKRWARVLRFDDMAGNGVPAHSMLQLSQDMPRIGTFSLKCIKAFSELAKGTYPVPTLQERMHTVVSNYANHFGVPELDLDKGSGKIFVWADNLKQVWKDGLQSGRWDTEMQKLPDISAYFEKYRYFQ